MQYSYPVYSNFTCVLISELKPLFGQIQIKLFGAALIVYTEVYTEVND